MAPAFLDAIKNGMKDDYWFIEELQKLRLKWLDMNYNFDLDEAIGVLWLR